MAGMGEDGVKRRGDHHFICPKCGDSIFRPPGYRLARTRIALVRARDGDGCGICGLPVWFEAPISHHPAAPSVDHILPHGNGGCHCLKNLRLAHHWCNVKRADDPPGTKMRLRGCAGHMRKVLLDTPLRERIAS